MTITTLVNAVTTANVAGQFTNPTKTAFSATTSAYAIEVSVQAPTAGIKGSGPGINSGQTSYKAWFAHSSISVTSAAFPTQCANAKCVELVPKIQNNGITTYCSDALAAMGTYVYCWVEMPNITATGGTISVFLLEMN